MNIKQAVVFAILMENGKGIMTKSPDYVDEKLRICELGDPVGLLDDRNTAKYNEWVKLWAMEGEMK